MEGGRSWAVRQICVLELFSRVDDPKEAEVGLRLILVPIETSPNLDTCLHCIVSTPSSALLTLLVGKRDALPKEGACFVLLLELHCFPRAQSEGPSGASKDVGGFGLNRSHVSPAKR